MRRLLAFAVVVLSVLASSVSATAAPSDYTTLEPGAKPDLNEEVPVNVVFVGYDEEQVDADAFRNVLPSAHAPVIRSRLWYDITEPLGINYTYDVDVSFAGARFEKEFFAYLESIAEPAPLTEYQQAYNDQARNVVEVADNHHIDAPSVEQWLARRLGRRLGIDTSRNTIVFVNWYGRDDFKHHVYTKTDEPDPDTGYNFGEQRDSRKIIAWGGTTPDDEENGLGSLHRIWFYDLSAGPESWTDNWNVDDPDLDGDGVEEYRMPPVWEYAENGYREPAALSSDLGRVARYVGLDLLMTTSPLYPPSITPPELPDKVNVDSNTYEAFPGGVNASRAFIEPRLVVDELSELQRTVDYSYDNQDLQLRGQARRCYLDWLQVVPCTNRPYPAEANLFVYHALTLDRYLDGGGDYEAATFNYATGDDITPGFLGFADDNWVDGTQSFVFSFVSPGIVQSGYGLSTTLIHEVGHHVAMSHPHDGYDSETGDFEPVGEHYFAWSGDESNTMMSYIDLNWDFSQFDRDNMDRFSAAAYLEQTNAVAALILESDNARKAKRELELADATATLAARAFANTTTQAR